MNAAIGNAVETTNTGQTDISLDAKAARAACGISRALEKQISRDLAPAIAWPTLALAVVLPLTLVSVIAFGFVGILPLWACTPLLAVVSYAHYTLVHESIHGNVVSSPRSLAWINTVVGWVGSLEMGAGWPPLQRTHVLHHSFANTERDPDIIVKGTFVQLLVKWLIMVPMSLLPMFVMRFISPDRHKQIGSILSQSEIMQSSAVTLFTLLLLAAAIGTGHFVDWLCLWFFPTRLGILLLNIFFQWLPHRPFDRTERYHNTRISLWFGGGIALLQQNLHLMHHLWPSVPFYNYARLYRALKPVLRAEGSRIEGLMVGPHARAIGD